MLCRSLPHFLLHLSLAARSILYSHYSQSQSVSKGKTCKNLICRIAIPLIHRFKVSRQAREELRSCCMELHFDHRHLVEEAVIAVAHSPEHHDRAVVVPDTQHPDNPPVNRMADPADHADHAGPAGPAGPGDLDTFVTELDTFRTGPLDPVVGMREYVADLVVGKGIGFVVQVVGTGGCLVGLAVGRKASAAGPKEEDIGVVGPEVDTDHIQDFAAAVRMGHLVDHSLA